MKHRILFFLILFLGFSLRLYFIFVSPYAKSSVHTDDICTIGLMAKHILEGEFPLFFYGQYYLGPLEAFVTAVFFALFGIKIQIIYFSTLFFSCLFMISVYFLGKMLKDKNTGLIAMLYAAFPPSFFFGESVTPAGYHIELLVLGNILFIITLLVSRNIPSKKHIYYIILGILAGIAVWTHYTILYYLVPVGAYLLLKEKLPVLLKRGILTIVFGFVSALPFWIFTLRNNFITFKFGAVSAEQKLSCIELLKVSFSSIASMLGLEYWKISGLQFAILAFYITVFLYFILNKKFYLGQELIFIFLSFFTLSLYIFYRSRMGGTAYWYLIPVISFIPIYFAYFCNKIISWNRLIGVLVIIFVVLFNIRDISGLIKRDTAESKKNKDLKYARIRLLEEKRLNRIIGDDRRLREIEFYTKEKIIGTGIVEGDYFPHEDEVEASTRVAFERCESDWVSALDNICKSYKFEDCLYYDFKPFPYIVKSILPYNWRGESCKNSFSAGFAFDRNYETSWEKGNEKLPVDYFCIDLGSIYKVCRVLMISHDYPKGYKVQVSEDNIIWEDAAFINNPTTLFWSGPRVYWHPVFGRIEIFLKPTSARYVRLVNTADNENNAWRINEIYIYESLGEDIFKFRNYFKEMKELVSFLDKRQISFVYADYWPSAIIKKMSKEKVKALVPYNSWKPSRMNMERDVVLDKGKAIVIAKDDSIELEDVLEEFHIGYKKKSFNRYICYYFLDLIDHAPLFKWTGIGIAKYSLKDYSWWLYNKGYFSDALKYYPNNYLAYQKIGSLPKTRFYPIVEKPISFTNGIKFLGYSIRNRDVIPGKDIRIEYFWEVIKEPLKPLSVFVYFMKDNRIVFQNDHAFLFQFSKPINPLPAERFREVLKLKIPKDTMPGRHKIVIGLLDDTKHNRIKADDGSSKKEIGELIVSKSNK